MAKLSHCHSLQLGGSTFIVQEYANGGDLYNQIAPDARGPSMVVAQTWMYQLSQALMHMHERGIVHRDIKPENILLHDGCIRLCDFGLACLEGTSWAARAPGTRPYMAPETLAGAHVVLPSQDVWSLGIVLHGILFADLPWQEASRTDAEYAAYCRTESLSSSPILATPMAALLHAMLKPNPAQRATMADVFEFFSETHPWLLVQEQSAVQARKGAPGLSLAQVVCG